MDDTKKICVVGVLDNINSTNVYMAKAFAKLGFGIVPINYRNILAQHGVRVTEKTIIKVVEETKPVLTIFCKCNGIDSITMGKCSNISKTWFWWMDPIITLKRCPECISHAQTSDFSSCTGLGVAEYLCQKTQEKIYHIFEGIDPDVYYPEALHPRYRADVSFIGTANQERVDYLNKLVDAGYTVRAYGPGFGKEIQSNEFNSVCSSSKVMLAISNEHTTKGYCSDRIFRYGACRSAVVHSYFPEAEKYFTNEEALFFADDGTLLKSVEALLRDDTMRESITKALHEKVLRQYTWDSVAKTILEIAEVK